MKHADSTRRFFLKSLAASLCVTSFAGSDLLEELLAAIAGRTSIKNGINAVLNAVCLSSANAASMYEILSDAPEARYWVYSNQEGVDCGLCHDAVDERIQGIRAGRHAHKTPVVRCQLCPHMCLIEEGKRGRCRTRMHVNGRLKTLVYGRPVAIHVDPVEKKPLFHFLPGAYAYSMGTSGCVLKCRFCQNWEISQASPEDFTVQRLKAVSPVQVAFGKNTPIIAFTYNEPTTWTEFMLDVVPLAHEKGIKCVMISCGFINPAPLNDLAQVMDAIKIDLKGFSENFYQNVTSSSLKPVLESIKTVSSYVQKGRCHLEIVNLVVPTLNDSQSMLENLSAWVYDETGPDTPLHFTKFHPDYQLMNLPSTPVATLEKARDTATQKGLRYIYVGNVPGHAGAHTYCPACGKVVLKRNSLFLLANYLKDGKCGFCGEPIRGVWT